MLLLACVAAIAGPAQSADYFWPAGASPCNTTLQACVTGVPDRSRILIRDGDGTDDGYFVVQESLNAPARNLELRPAPGTVVDFAAGQSIQFDGVLLHPGTPDSFALLIEDLGFINGFVEILSDARAPGSTRQYLLEGLRVHHDAFIDCAIRFRHGYYYTTPPAGSVGFGVRNSRIRGRNGICVGGATGSWNVDLVANQFTATASDAVGIAVYPERAGFASGVMRITNNRIEPDVSGIIAAGIYISAQTAGGSLKLADTVLIRNNLVRGVSAAGGARALWIEPYDEQYRITNNTLVDNDLALMFFAGEAFNGLATIRLANNLLYRNDVLSLTSPELAGRISVDHNLIFGTTGALRGDLPPSSAGERISDPEFVARDDPRPRPGSPAVNAGTDDVVEAGDVDLNGDPRRREERVDIGAYESGTSQSVLLEADIGNSFGNYAWLGGSLGVPDPMQRLFTTPRSTPGIPLSESTRGNYGLFYLSNTAGWAAFWENLSAMHAGTRFNVGRADGLSFRHRTEASNIIEGYRTVIDHPALNANPLAIATVTHHFNGDLPSNTYHDHPVALVYRSDLGRWILENQDAAPFVAGVGFNIWVAPLFSPNATQVTADGSMRVPVRHPRLDGNACALAQATRRLSAPTAPFNPMQFVLDYVSVPGSTLGGYWSILSRGSGGEPAGFPLTPFPAGSRFNVLVDGAASNACGGPSPEPLIAWEEWGACSAPEGQSGTRLCTLRLRLDSPAGRPVQVLTQTRDGTATAGTDYQADPGTIRTIDPGALVVEVPVTLIGDAIVEPDEFLQVSVLVLDGAANLVPVATVTIVDDDTMATDSVFRNGFE